jgi:hypothetical protein
MPGGIINHEYDVGVLRGGINPRDITQKAGERLLQAPLPRHTLLPVPLCTASLCDTRRHVAAHQIERTEDVDHIVAVQITDDRPMPFNAQSRPQRRHHGKASRILTQQDELSGFGFFSRPAGLVGPPLADPDRP